MGVSEGSDVGVHEKILIMNSMCKVCDLYKTSLLSIKVRKNVKKVPDF